jgi:hypothetical protein
MRSLLLALSLLASTSRKTSAELEFDCHAAAVRRGERILLIGDSHAEGFGPHLQRIAERAGYEWTTVAVRGSRVVHWPAVLRNLLARTKPSLVLVSLGTNDAVVGDAANIDARISELQAAANHADAVLVWISPPTLPVRYPVRHAVQRAVMLSPIAFDSTRIVIARQNDGIHATPEGYAFWGASLWTWMQERRVVE